MLSFMHSANTTRISLITHKLFINCISCLIPHLWMSEFPVLFARFLDFCVMIISRYVVLVSRRPFYFWKPGPDKRYQEVSGASGGLVISYFSVESVSTTCMYSIRLLIFAILFSSKICFTWFLLTLFNHNLMRKSTWLSTDHYSLLLHTVTSPYSISINLRVPRPSHCVCCLVRLCS
jgi:hypothetical protein